MEKVFGVIRHIVGALGGGLVGASFIEETDAASLSDATEGVMGAIMLLIAIGTSIYAKVKAKV